MIRLIKTLVALSLCALFLGCENEAYITDQSNIETYVKNVTLCNDKTIAIVNGGSVQNIPLEAFSRIVIANEESKSIGGKLFFCASIEFKDGTKLDAKSKANMPLTFIDASCSLCGDTQKGHYTITIANVYKIILKSN